MVFNEFEFEFKDRFRTVVWLRFGGKIRFEATFVHENYVEIEE